MDTSKTWVKKDDLEKYGPEVMEELDRKYRSLDVSKNFSEDASSNKGLDHHLLTRCSTYSGEDCLQSGNISKDLKRKHSLIKQASLAESEEHVDAGPQSMLLDEDHLNSLHRMATENSKNLSSILNESSVSCERSLSKAVIDWDAKNQSLISQSAAQNPFNELKENHISDYKRMVTQNSVQNTKRLNLNPAEHSLSSTLSSDSETCHGDNAEKAATETKVEAGAIQRNSDRSRSIRKAFGNIFKHKNEPVELKITNLDTIDLPSEIKTASSITNPLKKKRKSFKRLFSFNKY